MLRKIHRKAVEAREAGDGIAPGPPEEGLGSQQEQKEARVLRRVDPDEPTPPPAPRPRPASKLNISGRIESEDFDPLMMELR
ncbi:hypothetical protein TWF481_011909 [Arthrobotrys musiformis]|uniref:Uncharacterized protein n=1 Tax=Arthrobotrys musiformis TaxID=47236 RepID=A0AAV9VVM2_9PEZI